MTSSAAGGARRPLYARLLRLRYLHPGPVACFLLFEGTIALGVLLALSELVDWPVMILLPVGVAVMVKINDVLAGATLPRFGRGRTAPVARGTAVVVDSAPVPPKDRVVGKAQAPAVERLPEAAPAGSAAVAAAGSAAVGRVPGAAPAGPAAVAPASPPPVERLPGAAPASSAAVERLPEAAPASSAAVERLPGAAPASSAAVEPEPGGVEPS